MVIHHSSIFSTAFKNRDPRGVGRHRSQQLSSASMSFGGGRPHQVQTFFIIWILLSFYWIWKNFFAVFRTTMVVKMRKFLKGIPIPAQVAAPPLINSFHLIELSQHIWFTFYIPIGRSQSFNEQSLRQKESILNRWNWLYLLPASFLTQFSTS